MKTIKQVMIIIVLMITTQIVKGQNHAGASVSSPIIKLDSALWEVYNSDTDEFIPCEKWVFNYNKEIRASLATYYWYFENQYLLSCKYELTDSSREFQEDVLLYNWNEGWDKDFKISYQYDSAGKIVLLSYQEFWDPVLKWNDFTRTEYYYDNNANDTLQIGMVNDSERGWVVLQKEKSVYDSVNRLVIRDHYELFANSDELVLTTRFSYVYDSKGYTEIISNSSPDSDSVNFSFTQKNKYSYNADSNLVEFIISAWQPTDSLWIDITKTSYIYDNSYKREAVSYPTSRLLNVNSLFNSFNPDGIKYKLVQINDSINLDSMGWIPGYRAIFYYSDTVQSASSVIAQGQPMIYPNPANDLISICYEIISNKSYLQLFDLFGKMVMNINIREPSLIPVSHLENGIYMLQLIDSGRIIFREKLIVL